MATINPLVVDLSHHDPAQDYTKVKKAGIVGVLYKATEGVSYTDPTYVDQQKAAKLAGLKWGGYHFGDGNDVDQQVNNFMTFCCPDPDEAFVLDWEDKPASGKKMSYAQAKEWITKVEDKLERSGQCVIYAGNTAKELVKGDDAFFGARRLWLCQYGSTPQWQQSWDTYWLWQYTDGTNGPSPHTIDGIGHCDINSYQGTAEELIAEWASGSEQPQPAPEPEMSMVHVNINTSGPVEINIAVNGEVVYGEEAGS